jgi:hypothetical protein
MYGGQGLEAMSLVQDEQYQHARVAIREIASDIARGVVPAGDEVNNGPAQSRKRPNAFAGLFHAYADMVEIIPGGMGTCAAVVEHCLNHETRPQSLGLFGGWAGLGWITSHLDADDDFVGAHADRLLTDALGAWPPQRGYDLISGLVGAGVCFVERLPRDSAIRGLTLVLAALEATAEYTDDGTTWFTPAEFLSPWQQERAPNGYFNLGVAHGVPGVIGLLGRVCAEGIAAERTKPLLRSSLSWIRAQQPHPTDPELPSWIAPGVPREPNRRVAWCYGPLGASAVVLAAANTIGDQESAHWATTLALACADVLPQASGNRDAGLCHGAAGNAQIFLRLHRNSGDTRFRDAARIWLEEVLAYRRPGEGVGGYRMLGDVGGNRQGWVDDASFLSGSGGVGLALLAATTEVEPKWDRLLLLS